MLGRWRRAARVPSIDYDLPPYDFYTDGAELDRRVARAIFKETVAEIPERIAQLRKVTAAFGVELRSTDEGLVDLGRWFIDSVEAAVDGSGNPAVAWRGLTHDVSLFLGEVVIERWPQISWGFPTSAKRSLGYQRASLTGFSRPPKSWTWTEHRVQALAYESLASRGIRPVAPPVEVHGIMFDLEASQAARDWSRPPDDDFRTYVERVGAKV